MFVPLDRLYEFCDSQLHDDILIYGFNPPGNKNISTMQQIREYKILNNPYSKTRAIPMIIHDQEPLNFEYYQNLDLDDLKKNPTLAFQLDQMTESWMTGSFLSNRSKKNLAFLFSGMTRCDVTLFTHSEKNSQEVEKYEKNNFVGIYWWSHALISRDWYRFAKLDHNLNFPIDNFILDFNIYNRAWSGSREYRLKFADLIIDKDLVIFSNIKFNPYEDKNYFKTHQFVNKQFRPRNDLEILPLNSTSSYASADYSSKDYQTCAIDVVLETLFDDTRWHLTEKILRPIACGKPFILAGTMGSLAYLKSYGFQTFGDYIDESYDLILDPLTRLDSITETMKNISALSFKSKKSLYRKLHQIAKYNKKLFWSEKFAKKILKEFLDNYQIAYSVAQNNMGGRYFINNRINLYKTDIRWALYLKGNVGWNNADAIKQCLIEINKFNRLK